MCARQAKGHGCPSSSPTNREGEIVDHQKRAPAARGDHQSGGRPHLHRHPGFHQALKIPVIEVHLSNIHRREPYRNHSYVSKGATGIVMGLGAQGYLRAVDAVAEILSSKSRSK
jgi:3-dehydroquinate dehydratase-2